MIRYQIRDVRGDLIRDTDTAAALPAAGAAVPVGDGVEAVISDAPPVRRRERDESTGRLVTVVELTGELRRVVPPEKATAKEKTPDPRAVERQQRSRLGGLPDVDPAPVARPTVRRRKAAPVDVPAQADEQPVAGEQPAEAPAVPVADAPPPEPASPAEPVAPAVAADGRRPGAGQLVVFCDPETRQNISPALELARPLREGDRVRLGEVDYRVQTVVNGREFFRPGSRPSVYGAAVWVRRTAPDPSRAPALVYP